MSRSCVIMTTVSCSCFCRYSISSSKAAALIGSRPEVGSSRNSSRGSSASARARAARLIMPPESCAGYLPAASGGRPTSRILRSASSSSARGRQLQVLDHRQLHVLQHGEAGVQRARLESDAVARLDAAQLGLAQAGDVAAVDAHRARRGALQSRGCVRSSTDLPVPEPPTMPNTSSACTSMSRPSCTSWVPKRLTSPCTSHHRVHQTSISMNSTANSASARITKKMACTTATVIRRPSSRAEDRAPAGRGSSRRWRSGARTPGP